MTKAGEIITEMSNHRWHIKSTRRSCESASMLYSNNMTTFTSLVDEGKVVLSEDDDILVGAPEGSDFM